MSRLSNLVHSHVPLMVYTALNYVDKGLTFAVPVIVLYVFKDRGVYNEIEYVYSIATIVAILIELGVRNYFFYAYKEAGDRTQLVRDVRGYFALQFALYTVLSTAVLIVCWLTGTGLTTVYVFIVIRSLYLYLVSYFAVYYRLVDTPSKVFALSISVSILTVALILVAQYYLQSVSLVYFFVSQALLVILAASYFVFSRWEIGMRRLLNYVKASLAFSWPIIIHLFLIMFVNNYGKVYARNFLTEGEMFHLSFVQRAALIIQLAHVSAMGYFSKSLYVDAKNRLNVRIFAVYSFMLALSAVAAFVFLKLFGMVMTMPEIKIDLVAWMLIVYTIVWCYASFFELYFGKMNKTKYIPLSSAVAAIVYLVLIGIEGESRLVVIASGMLISMLCYLASVLIFLTTKVWRGGAAGTDETALDDGLNPR
jgi:hypothetical protein